jgi:uncharacterized protein
MSATKNNTLAPTSEQALLEACGRIAPTWPLDQMIAVNPWWNLRHLSLEEISVRLGTIAGVRCFMPHSYYAELWNRDIILEEHLLRAKESFACNADRHQLIQHLETESSFSVWENVSELVDQTRDRQHRMSWKDEILHQISQFCGAMFQNGGDYALNSSLKSGFYSRWLESLQADYGISILMGESQLDREFLGLPNNTNELFQQAIIELGYSENVLSEVAHALLLDVGGWAAWVAYLEWQNPAQLNGHQLMRELLAIRMAWDLILWRLSQRQVGHHSNLQKQWQTQLENLDKQWQKHRETRELTWVWHRAFELSHQDRLVLQLQQAPQIQNSSPALQAIFCIDVRSEVYRRALEAQRKDIQTFGFAGFFGLPIEYAPCNSALVRPQLPGLLKPAIRLSEKNSHSAPSAGPFHQKVFWKNSLNAAPAMFSLVEATGLKYGYQMLKETFFPAQHHHPVNDIHGTAKHWHWTKDGKELTAQEKSDICCGILRNMSLTQKMAQWVMLIGHGSQTRNNPQSAGLDCGACGGQTGEVNVRALAEALNDPLVRKAIIEKGILIPSDTQFIAGLHNTTTDDVTLFDTTLFPEDLQKAFVAASAQARNERQLKLNIELTEGESLDLAIRQRAIDIGQVRPEWGLANNSCFVIAPRTRTAHLNLKGRAFLHDYIWQQDTLYEILEKIMTAPMIVTHWINMQYNASVADPQRYGSGNKLLHNVVGGNLGVYEGNGGDLRIGLALQSVHNGKNWMHEPLRLNVFIAAPRESIEEIMSRHLMLQQLINNRWLYLFRLDENHLTIESYQKNQWIEW